MSEEAIYNGAATLLLAGNLLAVTGIGPSPSSTTNGGSPPPAPPPPAPALNIQISGLTVTMTVSIPNDGSYVQSIAWGDGTGGFNAALPSGPYNHTYSSAGIYEIIVQAFNGAGVPYYPASQAVTVNPQGTIIEGGSPTQPITPVSVAPSINTASNTLSASFTNNGTVLVANGSMTIQGSGFTPSSAIILTVYAGGGGGASDIVTIQSDASGNISTSIPGTLIWGRILSFLGAGTLGANFSISATDVASGLTSNSVSGYLGP